MSILKRVSPGLLMLALWASVSGSAGARSRERGLYERLVRASFPSKNRALALGRLRSPQAKALLLKLLDKKMFHREVAYYGLLALKDQETDRKLAKRLLTSRAEDSGFRSAIERPGELAHLARGGL
ncbi:MAG: hypothetical protein KAI47_25230, partial [Deltaproteobacteria bacterium]|nr:hypothetical protein [Deltaproteobacteria bacterium]